MQKEINDARSTADPSLQNECTTLNVNGECLDHLDYTKGTFKLWRPLKSVKIRTQDIFRFASLAHHLLLISCKEGVLKSI